MVETLFFTFLVFLLISRKRRAKRPSNVDAELGEAATPEDIVRVVVRI